MEPVRLEIAPEVNLDYVRSDKFILKNDHRRNP